MRRTRAVGVEGVGGERSVGDLVDVGHGTKDSVQSTLRVGGGGGGSTSCERLSRSSSPCAPAATASAAWLSCSVSCIMPLESTAQPCEVCGVLTTSRCAACESAGISLFFCSRAHQKLVRPLPQSSLRAQS